MCTAITALIWHKQFYLYKTNNKWNSAARNAIRAIKPRTRWIFFNNLTENYEASLWNAAKCTRHVTYVCCFRNRGVVTIGRYFPTLPYNPARWNYAGNHDIVDIMCNLNREFITVTHFSNIKRIQQMTQ
jgi:hypothetical protein